MTQKIRVLLLLMVLGGFPALVWFGAMIPHNLSLWRFARSLSALEHPSDSKLLKRFSVVGLLESNGDHCDYLAGQVRDTDLTPDAVRAHYRKQSLPRVDPSVQTGFTEPRIEVIFPTDAYFDFEHVMESPFRNTRGSKRTLYAVYAIDAGYFAAFDLRCY